MPIRSVKLLPCLLALPLLALAACQQEQPTAPEPADTASAAALEPAPSDAPSADASGSAGGIAAELDAGALQERRDPERLLSFYTNALRIGDWDAAASAWSLDAQMNPDKLRADFGGDAGPKIAIGKGDWENAGGSLFYEVPVTVDFPDGRPSRRGTVILRRANDAPGASPLQLVWRIDRSALAAE
jgi:hypothetical protein